MNSDQLHKQRILTQSIFSTSHVETRSWRSYITSAVLHGLLILAALLIAVPVLRNQRETKSEEITLVAPVLPEYKPKVLPPVHQPSPVVSARNEIKPKLLPVPKPAQIKPPEVRRIEVPKPRELASAPALRITQPTPQTTQPVLETKLPPAPKPAVRTGSFDTADAARAPAPPKVAKVGGFGDPEGVPASANSRPSPAMLAQVGSFEMPEGGGHAGGGGRSRSGGVRQTTFGGAGEAGGAPGGTGHAPGKIQTGAFGEPPTTVPLQRLSKNSTPAQPAFTPVEILSKPKPAYTQEARALRLEGEVALDVVFLSSGSVHIVRVVHGLGHGLDEAAEQAALRVHFRPATRGGVPVDTSATIHITFQLT